jgi:hypothetical protein
MNRQIVYIVIAVLVVAAAVLGYLYYQEQQKPGIDIDVGGNGVSIETK